MLQEIKTREYIVSRYFTRSEQVLPFVPSPMAPWQNALLLVAVIAAAVLCMDYFLQEE